MFKKFSELLQKNGVSAYSVSKATGISQQTLSDWKKGKSQPKIDKLQKIADYFGVPLSYFTGENDINPIIKLQPTPTRFYYQLSRMAKKHNTPLDLLCRGLNIPDTEIDIWKRGYIYAKHLVDICLYFHCSADYLIGVVEVDLNQTKGRDEMSAQLLEKYKTLTFDQKISVMNYVINLAKENKGAN